MYEFRDTINAFSDAALPSEALQLNGEYIEEKIAGYRTLYVKGREALAPELNTYETGVRDGSVVKSKRFPARTITIGYQLIAETNEDFREAYNELGRLLDVEDAELIFNDEADKFYIGTPVGISDVEAGRNSVTGEIEIFCADPLKYSVEEFEAYPEEDNTVLIDYGGTYKSYPILHTDFYSEDDTSDDGESDVELTGDGECGYVAFFDDKENIIQLGNPDEDDGETYPRSQTLSNVSFYKKSSYGTALRRKYKQNAGISTSSAVLRNGTMGMKSYSHSIPSEDRVSSGTLLKSRATTSGTPTVYYSVSAKATGRTETTIKVTVTVTAKLKSSKSHLKKGIGLKASIYMDSKWHDVTLKKTTADWKGRTAHVRSISFTVSNLEKDRKSITGIKFKVERSDKTSDKTGEMSSVSCNALPIPVFETNAVTYYYYLAPTDFGTGSKWHGSSVSRTLPADKAGDVGAKSGTVHFSNKMAIGPKKDDVKQRGLFQVLLTNGSKILAGVSISKYTDGKKGRMRFYVNGKHVYEKDINLAYGNKSFKPARTSSISKLPGMAVTNLIDGVDLSKGGGTISKFGDRITFNVAGTRKTFRSSAIANTKITDMTVVIGKYGTKPSLRHNGLKWIKFIKNNCDTYEDVPNKFGADDEVEVDCRDGNIFLNEELEQSLGALGNDFEKFCLEPGLNQIGFSYSDWVKAGCEPTFYVKYREAYL